MPLRPSMSPLTLLMCPALACLVLTACGTNPMPQPVSRLSPPETQVCVEALLAQRGIQTEEAPLEQGAWRLRLRVLVDGPTGWLGKGDLIHDGVRVNYLPDGSTHGLLDDRIAGALSDVSAYCI